MRIFGFETDAQRERREAHEAEYRQNRDAAVIARQGANAVEAERQEAWTTIQAENAAKWEATRPPARDDSPEAVAARTAVAKTAGELEKERQRQHRALRDRVVQEALGARDAKRSAMNAGDIEAYVTAHARHAALDEFVRLLDQAERDHKQLAATPNLHGAVQL